MKLKNLILFNLFIAFLLAGIVVKADFNYSGNGSYGTLKINDNGNDGNPLYTVFNTFFSLSGDSAFTSGDQLYATYGLAVGDLLNIGDNAALAAIFKDAALTHTFSIVDGSQNTVATFEFPGNSGGTYYDPNDSQQIPSSGLYDLVVNTYANSESTTPDSTFYFDPEKNADGMIHMIVLDLTELFDGTPTLWIALEDLLGNSADWDYNDGVYMLSSTLPPGVPEPATILILGAGLVALPFVRKRRKK